MHIRETRQDRIFNAINFVIVTLCALCVLYPLYLVIINSFSDPNEVARGNVVLFPRGLSWEAYEMTFENKDILSGYANSLFYLVFGTAVSMLLTIPCAYALSKTDLFGGGFVMMLLLITMYFSGGLIPRYLVYRGLGLLNTRMAILLSGAVSTSNIIIARTFFRSGVPRELEEAAEIDGCTQIQTFLRIVLPLSKAMIFVIMLYYAVGRWNGYIAALYYAPSRREIQPLQLVLRRMMLLTQQQAGHVEAEQQEHFINVWNQMKYAVIVVASVPLLCIYPFIQKFFEKGIMLGSVKG